MKKYAKVFTLSFLLFFFILLYSETVKGQSENKCVSMIGERTAALVARDWKNLERLAENYINMCNAKFGSEDLSNAYEDIAMANYESNRPQLALSASEACIMTHYGNPGCHFFKCLSLIKLNRNADAYKELDITKKLLRHEVELAEQNLIRANTAAERELYAAKKYKFEAILKRIEK